MVKRFVISVIRWFTNQQRWTSTNRLSLGSSKRNNRVINLASALYYSNPCHPPSAVRRPTSAIIASASASSTIASIASISSDRVIIRRGYHLSGHIFSILKFEFRQLISRNNVLVVSFQRLWSNLSVTIYWCRVTLLHVVWCGVSVVYRVP